MKEDKKDAEEDEITRNMEVDILDMDIKVNNVVSAFTWVLFLLSV